jgi:hypothetical protein
MVCIVLLCSGLLAANPAETTPSADDMQAYRAAQAQAGRDADAHVRLALWCEAHGLQAERLKHLAIAVLRDPGHGTARGLLGQVPDGDRWSRPEALAGRIRADDDAAATLAEYNARRDKTPKTADAQWKLGLWCEQQGLKAQATAHFTVVVRLSPKREEAWLRLGCRRYDSRWLTPEQLAAETAEAEAQKQADKRWSFLLETWYRASLGMGPEAAEAEAHWAEVTDPRAVPTIQKVLARSTEPRRQTVAARLLPQIDGPEASRTLARLALFGRTEAIRRAAAEPLPTRDPRDIADPLIALLRSASRYRVRDVTATSAGELLVEGEGSNALTSYRASVDDKKGATESEKEAALQSAVAAAQEKLDADVAAVLRRNAEIADDNAPIRRLLRAITGTDLGDDREAWKAWWVDYQGYSYTPPPPRLTSIQHDVSVVTLSPPPPPSPVHHSCFGAGTPVRTPSGLRPIEDLAIGDQVLTQDTTSGVLTFRPIVAVFHNRPTATLRVTLGGETIVATGIHRFWRTGRGWAMARDLKPGDTVRTLGGLAKVSAVEADVVRPVFNLEVAHGRSFFVGQAGALVHDNSPVEPTSAPFDAGPTLAVARGNRVE